MQHEEPDQRVEEDEQHAGHSALGDLGGAKVDIDPQQRHEERREVSVEAQDERVAAGHNHAKEHHRGKVVAVPPECAG